MNDDSQTERQEQIEFSQIVHLRNKLGSLDRCFNLCGTSIREYRCRSGQIVAQAGSDPTRGPYLDRIIFVGMFNDIELDRTGSEERCITMRAQISSNDFGGLGIN